MATDEVLYHELVRASRMIAGVMNFAPADHWYQDSEEYLAVILTNIYVSDKGGPHFSERSMGRPMAPKKARILRPMMRCGKRLSSLIIRRTHLHRLCS